MATIRQLPSGRFNVQVRLKNAKPLSRSFDFREEAEQWAQEQEGGLRPHQNTNAAPLTFLALGKRYCDTVLKGRPSREIAFNRVERIARHFSQDARAITKQDVNAYRLLRLEQVSSTTCRDELVFIHRLFRWAHREMILDRNLYPSPCMDIAIPAPNKPRSKVIERGELDRLLSVLSPTMKAIVELAYETAMRRSEIVKLTPRHLHLEERVASVIDGKTGDRDVPLSLRAVELLRRAVGACNTPESRLFPVTPHSVSTAVRRARTMLKLDPDIRLHQLRHTRITLAARKGLNQAQIMIVSGHRDVRSVQRYTHLCVKDVIGMLD